MEARACDATGANSERREGRTSAGLGRLSIMATEQQEHLKIEQLRQQSADDVEVIAGREKENLEGWIPPLATEAEIREALEKAFDYRGDVTITLKNGEKVEGYLFDRRSGSSLADSFVRVIPTKEKTKVNVIYADIA